jgi:PTS system mannose-specific IID component
MKTRTIVYLGLAVLTLALGLIITLSQDVTNYSYVLFTLLFLLLAVMDFLNVSGRNQAYTFLGVLLLLVVLAFFSIVPPGTQASTSSGVTINAFQAILIALLYYLSQGPWLANLGFTVLYRPLAGGFLVGLVLGDPIKGTAIGATINLVYLGFITAGGTLPADPALAGILGTALAIASGLPTDKAALAGLAIAVPLGLLGTAIFALRMTVDSVFAHWADYYADRANIRMVGMMNWVPGQILLFIISFPLVFLGAYGGPAGVTGVINFFTGSKVFSSASPLGGFPWNLLFGTSVTAQGISWGPVGLGLLGVLFTLGGVLAAVGIAMNLKFLFKGAYIPYYFLGFVMALFTLPLPVAGATPATKGGAVTATTPINIVVIAVVGAALAFIHVFLTRKPANLETLPPIAGAETDVQVAPVVRTGLLERSDVFKAWLTWLFFSHANYNYERLQATGFVHSMTPIIRKLYKEPEEIKAALQRHLVFFNTQPDFGGVIHGMTIAMEEERAAGADVSDEAINGVKTGLMGPMAGIGDTLQQGTVIPIFLAIGISLGKSGNLLGPLLYILVIAAVTWGLGWFVWLQGYLRGKDALTNFMQSGILQQVITGASIMGLVVMGALTVQFVTLTTPLVLRLGGSSLAIQSQVLNQFMPLLLPLGITLLFWYLLQKKRVHPLWLIAGTVLVIFFGSLPFFGDPVNGFFGFF